MKAMISKDSSKTFNDSVGSLDADGEGSSSEKPTGDLQAKLVEVHSYDSLIDGRGGCIDSTKKEEYLKDEEFERIFGMTHEEFNAMPKWRRDRKKKEVGLF